MSKLIICCAGRPALNGHKRRTFLWSEKYKAFVHEGRELTEAELNACCEAVFKKNWDLHPFVKVAEFSDGSVPSDAVPADDGSKAKIADLQEKLAIARADAHTARNEANAKILELTAKLEAPSAAPSLEEALEIVGRLAPERLKKRMGRPPGVETVEA
jgi:hypothetical protein